MSDYMMRRPTAQEIWDHTDHSGTLFATPDDSAHETTPGASVSVRERYLALQAISDTMGYINQARGFEKVHTRADVQERYAKPSEIAATMKLKSKSELGRFRENVAVLTADTALLGAGFGESDVELNAIATKHEILQDFGPNTKSEDRARKLRKVNKGI